MGKQAKKTSPDTRASIEDFLEPGPPVRAPSREHLPSFRILYAVWDCKEAYRKINELRQRTQDGLRLHFDIVDLSKEDEKIEKLRNAMMFSERFYCPSYDYVIIELGKDGSPVDQPGWAYFFVDACKIGIGGVTLIAESDEPELRKEAASYCFEFEFVTSLTSKLEKNGTFEALLRNGF